MLTRFWLMTCIAVFIPLHVRAEDNVDSSNVYQRIKEVDDGGLSVGRFREGAPAPTVDILLDEQGQATGGRSTDAADRPLFREVNESKLSGGTYPAFIALLDNYVIKSNDPENYSDNEKQEIEDFLTKVLETRPMKTAYAYVKEDLGLDMPPADFRKAVHRIWFELYPNHFGGNHIPDCTGFEHVFVGEGKYGSSGSGPRKGEISGYHSWVKFLRDEMAGAANYLGHKYDLPASRIPANPGVITLRMLWIVDDGGAVELFKPKGGFFVGLSPECEIAMGTVAFFEHREGMFTNDKRRVAIDGVSYDLVLYPSMKAGGQRGDHIRSFYPVLIGLAAPSDDAPPTAGDGPVEIVRAMPNPAGDDEQGEWVEVKNTSDEAVDLANWELRDRQGGSRPLSGTLAPNEVKRFEIPRAMFSMRLGNNGGKIKLLSAGELVQEVSYGDAASDKIFEF